jgi:large subunit ribosomal protein L1
MSRRGKKYLNAIQKVDRTRTYAPAEALDLVKEVSYESFDATVEVHLRMALDSRRSDQHIRGVVRLPKGLGTTVRVLVFATPDAEPIAEQAGADYIIMDDEGIQKIMDGWTDFDVAIAVPAMMPKVGRLGRILGPRGLMPNPKTGTMVQVDDLEQAVKDAKAGLVEYRLDRTGNIHCPIGKVSFPTEDLLENMTTIMDALRRAKPPGAKGIYIRKVTLASTMGPGVKVNPQTALGMGVSA